jgi:hypothetical protein
VIAFNALNTAEQEEAFDRIGDLRLRRLAGEESTPSAWSAHCVVSPGMSDTGRLPPGAARSRLD